MLNNEIERNMAWCNLMEYHNRILFFEPNMIECELMTETI